MSTPVSDGRCPTDPTASSQGGAPSAAYVNQAAKALRDMGFSGDSYTAARQIYTIAAQAVSAPVSSKAGLVGAHTFCTLGVGCDETGVCYALNHGEAEQCGRIDYDTIGDVIEQAGEDFGRGNFAEACHTLRCAANMCAAIALARGEAA